MSEPVPVGPFPLEQVFREHQRRVFRAAYRITGNAQDAEDVLQTVFLRLARREPGTLPVDNLSSYLYRAAINAAFDLLRSRRDTESVALEEAQGSLPAPVDGAPDRIQEAQELRAWLRRALTRLRPRAAEAFTLRYLEGYENHDIARILGISRVAVAVTLHRTRRRLRKELRRQSRERSGIHSPRVREADPLDERRRIHFANAEEASGGSGGRATSAPQLKDGGEP
jgi:RNA polymerase sigma-70 factor, ECF subfamily